MSKSEKVRAKKLLELEAEFLPLLRSCLERCARGRYGLFGQNEHIDPKGHYSGWPEAARAREIAGEMRSIRMHYGEVNAIGERFLELCSLRGANVPGEPELAASFLEELMPKLPAHGSREP